MRLTSRVGDRALLLSTLPLIFVLGLALAVADVQHLASAAGARLTNSNQVLQQVGILAAAVDQAELALEDRVAVSNGTAIRLYPRTAARINDDVVLLEQLVQGEPDQERQSREIARLTRTELMALHAAALTRTPSRGTDSELKTRIQSFVSTVKLLQAQ